MQAVAEFYLALETAKEKRYEETLTSVQRYECLGKVATA